MTVQRLIRSRNVEGVFPQPDQEVQVISKIRDQIGAKTFLPDQRTVETCLDKYEALESWNDAGLRNQPMIIEFGRRDEDQLMKQLQNIDYPCWTRAREGAGGLLSCLAKDCRSLSHWIEFHWGQDIQTDFVVEDYLPGRDFCFMSIWEEGRLVTSMVRERLSWVGNRMIGTGGTSKLNRVVHIDKANRMALKAIAAVTKRPHGIFCVDLKEDKSGDPRPTEINCRFTTNVHYLTLASIRFGRPEWNFPWLAARLMLGETTPSCQEFDALPDGLFFTKNVDMGFTIVVDGKWRAVELVG